MAQYVVEMNRISKGFPGVQALDEVDFRASAGEVMALLGENGAGKSTLVKILSGVYTRDSGSIRIFGKEVKGDLTPTTAREAGIAIIHQELNMCPHLTVAENIFLGRERSKGAVLSNREMYAESKAILDKLKIRIDPDTVVGDLVLGLLQPDVRLDARFIL